MRERNRPRRRAFAVAALTAAVAITGLAAVPGAEAKQKAKGVQVKVMTRNLFLGADLGPALNADTFNEFTAANGAILREVDRTDFPRRAKGLAAEIKSKKPDLVGLQEGAWWRTGTQDPTKPYTQGPDTGQYTATDEQVRLPPTAAQAAEQGHGQEVQGLQARRRR